MGVYNSLIYKIFLFYSIFDICSSNNTLHVYVYIGMEVKRHIDLGTVFPLRGSYQSMSRQDINVSLFTCLLNGVTMISVIVHVLWLCTNTSHIYYINF